MIALTAFVVPLAGVTMSFAESHLSGKVICLVLMAGSIVAWSIMVTKIRDLSRATRASMLFLTAYRNDSSPVSLFLKRQRYASPLSSVYDNSCEALSGSLEELGNDTEDLFMGGTGGDGGRLSPLQVKTIQNVARRTMADETLRMEQSMGFLATAVTSAPFLGLLGTVWGVMVAFGEIKGSGQPMISQVAPGIAGALLTTVVGLLVALPSSIGYNIIATQIRVLRVRMDNFTQELMADIERHFSARE